MQHNNKVHRRGRAMNDEKRFSASTPTVTTSADGTPSERQGRASRLSEGNLIVFEQSPVQQYGIRRACEPRDESLTDAGLVEEAQELLISADYPLLGSHQPYQKEPLLNLEVVEARAPKARWRFSRLRTWIRLRLVLGKGLK